MEETKKTVKFDPGYAPLVIDDLGKVGYIYYSFNSITNLKIKRNNFLFAYKRIESALKINVSFYLGCLMWASYIKKFENAELEGNMLLGETASEEEYTSEINFLLEVITKQLPRDAKYFSKINYVPNGKYLNILETYKQFLILNDGFVNCANVSQIKLPDNLKKLNQEELNLINQKIQKALDDKNIIQLLDSYELIF